MYLPFSRTVSKKGFTLIELLVSISLIAIITGALVPSFTSYLKNQNVKQAQEQIKSDLRSAQNRALNGSLSNNPVDGGTVSYWGIRFNDGSSTYYTFVSAEANATVCSNYNDSDNLEGSFTLANEIYIDTPEDTGGCLFFSNLDGSITATGSISEVIVTSSGTGPVSRRIYFNEAGLIYTLVD